MPPKAQLESAFTEWESVLGKANMLHSPEIDRYREGTTSTKVQIEVVLLPETREQIIELVRTANRYSTPLYPISTGKNWGYGDARPAQNGCVIIDLSKMNRVLDLDPDLGIVTLEPGVTQEGLQRYLRERNLQFMVPVTGAGPNTSILGNALERGYGITPQADHFLAVTQLEAVLPSGDVYNTPLTSMGAGTADKAYKWGIGPYLDGIFTQGAFGIVTSASVALVRKPEVAEIFYFKVEDEGLLGAYTNCVRTLLEKLGSLVGGVNLMNAHRMLAMLVPYPSNVGNGVLSEPQIKQLMKQERLPRWTGAGSLYCPKRMVAAARSIIRGCLAPIDKNVRFVDRQRVAQGFRMIRFIPSSLTGKQRALLKRARTHLDLIEGEPSEVALPLSYWRSGVSMPPTNLDPARDGCGLLWYTPLVPMKEKTVAKVVSVIRRICTDHQIEPLMTLTSLSNRSFDLSVPILFSQKDPVQASKAQQCYEQLFKEGEKLGALPYRVGIESMPLLLQGSTYWKLVSELKHAVDPKQIIAPGRYSWPANSEKAGAMPEPRRLSDLHSRVP